MALGSVAQREEMLSAMLGDELEPHEVSALLKAQNYSVQSAIDVFFEKGRAALPQSAGPQSAVPPDETHPRRHAMLRWHAMVVRLPNGLVRIT